jgi:hypothetical protein
VLDTPEAPDGQGDLARALEILREVAASGRYREPRFQVRPVVT